MRNDLSLGGFKLRGMANPKTEQGGVNLRTLTALEMRVLEQATSTVDTVISDAIRNHANILNREIRVKSLNFSPDGLTEKISNMNNKRIVGLPDPQIESESVNLRTLNRKIMREIDVNNQLEALKYLRLDGENQVVSDLQMNSHKIVGLSDANVPTDGVNLRTQDATVKSLPSENYVNGLILATNENLNSKTLLHDGTTMPTQAINFNHHKITHLEDPVDNLDALNLQRLNLMLSEKTFSYINGSAQEDLKMNTRQIINLGQPPEPEHCATKQYVDRMFNRLRTELLTCEAVGDSAPEPETTNSAVSPAPAQPLSPAPAQPSESTAK